MMYNDKNKQAIIDALNKEKSPSDTLRLFWWMLAATIVWLVVLLWQL